MQIIGDLRLSIRRLSAERGIAFAAILTLAIGIAGCTAMFAIVRAVLLRSMAIAAPEELVVMWPETGGTAGEFSYSAYKEERHGSTYFTSIALTGSTNWPIPIPFEVNGRHVHVTQCVTSGNFFDVLGARPSLGRTFVDDDDRPGAPPVVVLSDRFWRANFGDDVHVVGRRLGEAQIIGVMPPDFFYPAGADVWAPAARVLAGDAKGKSPGELAQIFDSVGAFHLVARGKPGVSPVAAQAEVTRLWLAASGLAGGNTNTNAAKMRVAITPFSNHVFGMARRALWLLMGSVGLVLAVACANVAGLLVARNAARSREFAVRAALGASRWHLARQNVIDALVVAGAGGVLGIGVAYLALPLLVTLSPTAILRLADARVNSSVAFMAVGISAVATVIVGVIPALQVSDRSLVGRISSTSTGQVRQSVRRRTRGALVVGQVAIAVILLVEGALALQSLRRLAALDLGYYPARVVSANISQLDQTRYAGHEALVRATEEIIRRVSSLPDVQSAAGVLVGPFAHGAIGWDSGVLVEGQPDTPIAWTKNSMANAEAVTPRYFETMGIRRLSGRDFTAADRADAPLVAIVSGTLAAHLWPGQNPIGKRLRSSLIEGGPNKPVRWLAVVGVVVAARYRELDRVRDDLYVPLAQVWDGAIENVVVQTSGDPRALIQPIGAVLSTVDPQLDARDVTTMDDIIGRVQMPWRFNMQLSLGFGSVAVGLTMVALVGLIGTTVSWRRREIGVRVALGAQRAQVVHLIMVEGMRLVLLGVGLGLVGALGLSRVLSNLLFEVSARDPLAFVASCVGVLGLGAAACYVPARRAAFLDPSVVFRDE